MMIHFFPYLFIIGLVLLIPILVISRVAGKPASRLFIYSLMWVYLLLVGGLTIFPIPYNGDFLTLKPLDQLGLVLSRINWIPFHNLNWYNGKILLIDYINNILLTIPFGILINFFVELNWKTFFWVLIASGLVIETSQFIMSLFFGPYRTVDINDVILNTLGYLIGCLMFITAAWIVHKPGKPTQK